MRLTMLMSRHKRGLCESASVLSFFFCVYMCRNVDSTQLSVRRESTYVSSSRSGTGIRISVV